MREGTQKKKTRYLFLMEKNRKKDLRRLIDLRRRELDRKKEICVCRERERERFF